MIRSWSQPLWSLTFIVAGTILLWLILHPYVKEMIEVDAEGRPLVFRCLRCGCEEPRIIGDRIVCPRCGSSVNRR
jgi:hypothetical protein